VRALAAGLAALLVPAALAAPAGAQTAGAHAAAAHTVGQSRGQSAEDAALQARVGAALEAAADLPADSVTVQVRAGVVTLSGSVVCDDCGCNATPGGAATVQQSLGAVVRAVPGVERVEFRLRYPPD